MKITVKVYHCVWWRCLWDRQGGSWPTLSINGTLTVDITLKFDSDFHLEGDVTCKQTFKSMIIYNVRSRSSENTPYWYRGKTCILNLVFKLFACFRNDCNFRCYLCDIIVKREGKKRVQCKGKTYLFRKMLPCCNCTSTRLVTTKSKISVAIICSFLRDIVKLFFVSFLRDFFFETCIVVKTGTYRVPTHELGIICKIMYIW